MRAAAIGKMKRDQVRTKSPRLDSDKTGYVRPSSPILVGLKSRCPRCGRGKLYAGFLTLANGCDQCGLDYDFADADDGPAVLITLVVGAVVVGLALAVEVAFSPPFIVHALLWLPLLLVMSLGLLRPLKSIMISIQYVHDAREGEIE